MKLAIRLCLLVLVLGLLLYSGVLFRFYLFEYIVRPVAVVLWVLWQIVLSVDQRVLWGLLIFSAVSYAVQRLVRIPSGSAEQTPRPDSNATLDRVRYWRTSILYTTDEIERPNILKHDLEQMLVAVYASKQPETSRLEIYKALRLLQFPLPEHIYAFLFPAEPSGSKRSIKQILQTFWQTPKRWARRRAGRDVAEYYNSIEDVLTLIESTLEINYGDEQFDTHNH
jgi:hypothetical protein